MITIYAIWCHENGKHYIGCTAGKPQKRFREHRCLLKAGKHACKGMQNDWNEFGERIFHLKPHLEFIFWSKDVKVKREAELKWIDHYANMDLLYNENRNSFSPPKYAPALAAKSRVKNGYRPTAESNLKRRLAQLGKPKNHGAKISATKRRKADEIVCSIANDKL